MIPGFALSLLSIVVVSKLSKAPVQEVLEEFDEVRRELKENYH